MTALPVIGARLDPLDPPARRAAVARLMARHGARVRDDGRRWRLRLLGHEAVCKATPDGALDLWAWAAILASRRDRAR